jgi:tetratricopeptide (TPR) repeat protein
VLQDDAADGVLSGEELERGSVVAVWGVLAAILLLTLLVYTGSLNNEFVHDDWPSVSENQHLRDLGNLDDFFLDPGLFSKTGRSRHTRPVLLVTFALNYAFGSEPRAFRVVNLALHLVNIILSFLLVRRIFSGRLPWRQAQLVGLLAAGIFAVHPLNVQAVIYISSRSTLLAFTFYVSAILLYLRWRGRLEQSGRISPWSLGGFLLCVGLALLTKEHTVSIAGALILLEVALFQSRERNARRFLATLTAGVVPVLVLLLYRLYALEAGAATADQLVIAVAPRTAVAGGYVWHLATQVEAQLVYLRLFMWPSGLAIQHVVPHVRSLASPAFIAASLAALAALAWALPRWWRGCALAVLVLWYLGTMVPEALVRLNMIVNEHRFYLPGIALIAFVSRMLLWLRSRAARRAPWAGHAMTAGLCAIVLVLGVRSWDYAGHWKTTCTLWEHTVEVSPGDSWTQNNAGNCRLLADDLSGAEEAYLKALELAPDNYLALHNMGIVRERQGRLHEAIRYYELFEEQAGRGQPLPEIRRNIERLRRLIRQP